MGSGTRCSRGSVKVPSAFLVGPLEGLGVLTKSCSWQVLAGWGLWGPEQNPWDVCVSTRAEGPQ